MNRKVLFLRANTGWKDPSPPMAFAYLGKIAKDAGFEVLVENLNAQYNTKNVGDVIELIKKEKPIVGISIFTNYARDSYDLMKKIRPYCEILIAGGPHVTIYPEETLEQGADIAVVGEAEGMFKNLLEAVFFKKKLDKIRGIVYKERGKIKKNPAADLVDLEKLPLPDKDIFRKEDYMKVSEEINNFGGILSSRGCPGRCTYCFHSLFGRCFRYRSAKSVFNEIKYLHDKYGITHINFIDDAFTINKKRLLDLCDMLIESRLPVEWVCATRIDFLDRDIIFKMKKAGCVMISLGIESCIPETLIKMGKTTNPEWYIRQSENVLKWCYEAGIRAGINILTGFPWDKAEDIKKIQRYVKKISRYVTQDFCGGVLQPMPQTEVYEKYAKKYGFEKWWLYKKRIFEKKYHPFFMLLYHPFWEQLNNNFFNLDKEVFKEIDRLYRMMGQWNLKIISKRRFRNPMINTGIYHGLLMLSKMSLALYEISPKLEEKIMNPIAEYSYRFKYKK
ncbi:MAG TPA: radical SAM protein [Patescibacteria group bacterium]|nr:radical SAM protein [Patescibacteria group bacterium]